MPEAVSCYALGMAFAVFAGDAHYHLIVAGTHRTLCGLRTVNRRGPRGEYLPPAMVRTAPPHRDLFSPCPRCEAERYHPATTGETTRIHSS